MECGGLTPLWSFLSSPHAILGKRKKEKKESGVKPPHSKVRLAIHGVECYTNDDVLLKIVEPFHAELRPL